MFTLSFLLVLRVTLQCEDNKELSAGDGRTMWLFVCVSVVVARVVHHCLVVLDSL